MEENFKKTKIGDFVKVHFTCKQEDGTVFDSSVGEEPLTFTIGEGQVMEGLDQAVTGMNQGESKTVKIAAEKLFGPHLAEKVHIIEKEQFPANLQPVIGMKFEIKQEDGSSSVIRVTDVSESSVTMDSNHPLAGRDLFFEIQLIEFQQTNISKAADFYDQGIAFQDKGQLEEAITCYQKAIELNKNHTGAFYNMGVAFQKKGLIDKAIIFYEIAIGLNQELVEAHHNLGVAYKEKGLFDEAIICFQRVLQLKPDHASAFYNLGNTFMAKGQYNEALWSYGKAIEIAPDHTDSSWSIALINLLFGNFNEGWKEYELRWELKDVMVKPHFSQPLWDGTDLKGKTILIYAEQGFGDTIQFVRYVSIVAQSGGKVILTCQKELVSLLKNVQGVHKIMAYNEQFTDFDIHCPLLSLPLRFGTTLETIPASIPYITPDSSLVQHWFNKIKSDTAKTKIGLVWAGDSRYKYGHIRSCSLQLFYPFFELDDITFYSLQKDEASEQTRNLPAGMKIVDYTDEIHDFSDTAALIQNLDLIISVDTAVAHLSGALGKTVWTLIPYVPDWRWLLNRDDSPWYPTMKLFRQPSQGDWKSVIEDILKALKALI